MEFQVLNIVEYLRIWICVRRRKKNEQENKAKIKNAFSLKLFYSDRFDRTFDYLDKSQTGVKFNLKEKQEKNNSTKCIYRSR